MNYSKISVRYARALFQLAKEKQILEDIKKDIELIIEVLHTNPELEKFLKSPAIPPSKKNAVLLKAFENSVHPISISFLKLVVQHKREEHIYNIARGFIANYKTEKNIKTAIITTSYPIDGILEKKLKDLITDKYKSNIELVKIVKPEIVGGFLIRVDDQLIDASVSTQLKKMKDTLIKERI